VYYDHHGEQIVANNDILQQVMVKLGNLEHEVANLEAKCQFLRSLSYPNLINQPSINQALVASHHGIIEEEQDSHDIVSMEVEGNSPMRDEVQETPDNESVHS
jgi:hypothetical protein